MAIINCYTLQHLNYCFFTLAITNRILNLINTQLIIAVAVVHNIKTERGTINRRKRKRL